jgi:2,5-furandicarboxylate decarboxylase 1
MTKDLRSFLNTLEQQSPPGLLRVKREVSRDLELTAVLRKLQEQGEYPAVLFEKVTGCAMPVVANVLGNAQSLALALDSTQEKMLQDYIRREDKPQPVKMVDDAPVHEVVVTGPELDLNRVPIATNCEKDSGRFITAGMTIVKDPDTGVRNVGIYRAMILSPNELGMSYEKHTHIGHIHRKLEAKGQPLPAAVVVGHHPACMLGSQSKVPFGVDECEVMGALMGEPLEMVKCKTIDLEVPARAELVFEGYILPDVRKPEGPFGEFTWYYGLERNSPVMQVTAITHRKDAIYQHLFAAHPEHNYAGKIGREAVLYKRVKATVPTVRDVRMPMSGICRFTAYVQIAKEYDGEGKLAALAALAADPFVKLAVIVDQDVNINDDSAVLWAIATRTQPDQSTFFVPNAAVSRLDPASYSIWSRVEKDSLNTKWAIDATCPIEAPFEERAEVPDELWRPLRLSDYLDR